MSKRRLILENGTIFEGEAFGADIDVTGELVFSTGMTGYQESITDQSYNGQILTFTYPLVGNYGINRDDFESIKPLMNAGELKSTNALRPKSTHQMYVTAGLDSKLSSFRFPRI